jgi:hypothetical protein
MLSNRQLLISFLVISAKKYKKKQKISNGFERHTQRALS